MRGITGKFYLQLLIDGHKNSKNHKTLRLTGSEGGTGEVGRCCVQDLLNESKQMSRAIPGLTSYCVRVKSKQYCDVYTSVYDK